MDEIKKKRVVTAMECCANGAECDHCPYSDENVEGAFEGCYQMHWDAQEILRDLLKEQEWIPISERLPENAEHPGAFCPKVRVLTVWGESYGWYNPDVKAWYFLEWYTDCSRNHLDFERGDYPGICYTPWNTNLITHWKPIP